MREIIGTLLSLEENPEFKLPREYWPVIHAAAEFQRSSGAAGQAALLLERTAGRGVQDHLPYKQEHAQQTVLALFEAGRPEEAWRIVEYYLQRPYLFSDISRLSLFLFLEAERRLGAGRSGDLAYILDLLLRTAAGACHHSLRRLGLRRLSAAPGLNRRQRSRLFLEGLSFNLSRLGSVSALVGTALGFALRNWRRASSALWPGRRGQRWFLPPRPAEGVKPPRRALLPILVTRAMGGIGDILMMTPGLRALRHKFPGREIHFAIPKAFHPLLENNGDAAVLDIDGAAFYREDYAALYNLTDCPAAKIETLTLPKVVANRIEIFSRAMGVGRRLQARIGYRPVYEISAGEKAWAENFWREKRLMGRPVIGLHLHAADSYKDWPHFEELAGLLAPEHPLLLLDNRPVRGFDLPGIHLANDLPLRRALALAARCRALVVSDSAFTHFAGLWGLPAVALFGPTDGTVFCRHYPSVRVCEAPGFPCAPCWRHQGLACVKTGNTGSACLAAITAERARGLLMEAINASINFS